MSYPTGEITLQKGKHRLHEHFFLAGTICSSLSLAFIARLGARPPSGGETADLCAFQCHQLDRYVAFQNNIIDQALANAIPDSFQIRILEQPRGKSEQKSWPIQRIFAAVAANALVQFYSDFRPWFTTTYGNNHTKFPSPWRFARVVRNAASHGGVHIDDETFQPVSWSGLTYGPKQNGNQIFGGDLSIGDLFVLMLEMNDSLSANGCSIAPPTLPCHD